MSKSTSFNFSLPYNFKPDHPKFAGLVRLFEMFQTEGKSLLEYIQEETKRINCEIEAELTKFAEQVEWVWGVEAKGIYPSDIAYQIIATPTLDGEVITDEGILSRLHLRDGAKTKRGFVFRIINNVMITNSGGHIMHYVDNGTILSEEEVLSFNNGIVPNRFRAFGQTPKS